MPDARIVIAGGGLAGLYAAYRLEQRGIRDYLLLETRDTFGGRIASGSVATPSTPDRSPATGDAARFDLGPTWFWPELQPALDRLVADLGLARFAQHEAGDLLVERAHDMAPRRVSGFASTPPSMRLAGGMGALVDALRRGLDGERLLAGRRVGQLHCDGRGVRIRATDRHGLGSDWRAQTVLLAVPPRLALARIGFSPALPDELAAAWRETPTWMAPHAKYLAVYATPFWREAGLSGAARSARGPLAEIHDASAPGGYGALFGFVGVPARVRATVSDATLRDHCRGQLARLFGARALEPVAEFLKDWTADPDTATETDRDAGGGHGAAPPAAASAGPWRDRLTGIASEWSPIFPGYLAGAVDAAARAVRAIPEHPAADRSGTAGQSSE